MTKLVGYRRFTSKKKNKDYCMATVVHDLSERDISNGCVGQKMEEVFMPEELTEYLNPSHIGKEVKLEYELSNGRAYLVNLSVVTK